MTFPFSPSDVNETEHNHKYFTQALFLWQPAALPTTLLANIFQSWHHSIFFFFALGSLFEMYLHRPYLEIYNFNKAILEFFKIIIIINAKFITNSASQHYHHSAWQMNFSNKWHRTSKNFPLKWTSSISVLHVF